jgi:tetratricopeptide (TPR) repeat protein
MMTHRDDSTEGNAARPGTITPPDENGSAPRATSEAPDSLFAMGLAARREGQHERAVEMFGRAIEAAPGNAEYRWNYAAACFALKRFDEAVEAYGEASRLSPGSAAYRNDIGVVLARQGKHDEAAECYREAIRLNPAFPDAHNNLGNAIRVKGRLDEAVACYQEALRLRPAYPEAHNNLGIALRHKGKLAEAVASYQEALRLRPAYPEAHNNLGLALAAQGRHEAAAVCYQQAARLKPDYTEAILNLAGAWNDLNRHDDAVNAYRQAIRSRPNDARAHKNLGITLARQEKLDDAIASYREAIRLRPNFADAHNDLGIALARKQQFEDAAASYREALKHRPNYAEAHNNLGNALRNLGRFDEALAAYDRAVELKPNYADAFNNRGIAFAEQGRFDDAVASYARCLKLRPTHVDAHLNRSLTWLRQGNYALGWAEYEWRHRKRNAAPKTQVQPLWNGYPPSGQRILLVCEQGLGDTLQFIRYAPLLKERGATVIFECPSKLMKVLGTMHGIDQLYPQGQDPPEHDMYALLMTVPGLLGTAPDAIPAQVPYLEADPGLVAQWKRELAVYPEFKVGINWQGNRKYAGDFHRSMPLRHFAALARVPGVRLFSLQKYDGLEQLKALDGAFPVVDLGSRLDEATGPFMDTAAVLMNLDLFVTSDTAVAHLAGALGVPVWVPLSSAPGWQWMLAREDCPWYPTMRLFRQPRLGEWPAVFDRIAAELARLVPASARARSIGVRITPGELIERIAIREHEAGDTEDESARAAVLAELANLVATRETMLAQSPALTDLTAQVNATVRAIRTAEESVRTFESAGEFGPRFIVSARAAAAARAQLIELRREVDRLALDGPAVAPLSVSSILPATAPLANADDGNPDDRVRVPNVV